MDAMKHVGLNVAADPLFTMAYTGVNGGLVVVSADDPGCHSSQNEQDNRHYAPFAKVAMMEPSDSQECRDFVKEAFALSERFDTPVLLRLTTRICHSKGLVELGERQEAGVREYRKDVRKYVVVPAHARERHGLIDVVYNKSNIVIAILDNRVTAMTGHQENPGTGVTLMGEETMPVDIERIVKAVGIKDEHVRIVDPYNLAETEKAVKEAYEATEPFVIITRRECALRKDAQKKRENVYCFVDREKCRKCKACMKMGCPAIAFKAGEVVIDASACNGCTLCRQLCKFDAIAKVGE